MRISLINAVLYLLSSLCITESLMSQCNLPEGVIDISEMTNVTIVSVEGTPSIDTFENTEYYKNTVAWCFNSNAVGGYVSEVINIHLSQDLVDFDLFEYNMIDHLELLGLDPSTNIDILVTDTILAGYQTLVISLVEKHVNTDACTALTFYTTVEQQESLPDSTSFFIDFYRYDERQLWINGQPVDTLLQVGGCAFWDNSYLDFNFGCEIDEQSVSMVGDPFYQDSLITHVTPSSLFNTHGLTNHEMYWCFVNNTGEVLLDLNINVMASKSKFSTCNNIPLALPSSESEFVYQDMKVDIFEYNYVFPSDSICFQMNLRAYNALPITDDELVINYIAHGFPDNEFIVYQGCAEYKPNSADVSILSQIKLELTSEYDDKQNIILSLEEMGNQDFQIELERLNGSSDWRTLGLINDLVFVDQAVLPNTEYYYRAKIEIGDQVKYSNIEVVNTDSVENLSISMDGLVRNNTQSYIPIELFNFSGNFLNRLDISPFETMQLNLPSGTYIYRNLRTGTTDKFIVIH